MLNIFICFYNYSQLFDFVGEKIVFIIKLQDNRTKEIKP